MKDIPVKIDYEQLPGRKVEDILLDRLTDMFYAMQMRRGDLYDQAEEWVELLLSAETDSYNELVDFRKKLAKGYVLKLSEYYLSSREITNVIGKKRFLRYNKAVLDWTFRKDLLLKVVEIFFKRQILSFKMPTYATMEGLRNEKALEEPESE